MPDDQQPTAVLAPSFFEGRLMIDILSWNWNLRVAISSAATRPKARFQGLDYGRDFTIHGQVRAPRELRGKTMKVTLAPFGPKVRFGRGGLQQVGRMKAPQPGSDLDFEAILMLPEEAIPTTATSLASNWKHLDIWTFGEELQVAGVSAYSFSMDIHPNLRAWADGE
jgi:hypothetical protein